MHEPTWFNGKEADVQRRFGAALVTAHAMREVDPVARVAQEHLLREARARYTDADGWMQAAVLSYTEAMAELADRDEDQGRADRAEEAATAVEVDPERAHGTLVMEGVLEDKADREEALADREDGRSLDDLDRALDESVEEQAREVQEVVEEGFPVEAQADHARHVGKAGVKVKGGRTGERSRSRTQDRGR